MSTLAGVQITCPKCGSEMVGGEEGAPRRCPSCDAEAIAGDDHSSSKKVPANEPGALVILGGIISCIVAGILFSPTGPAALLAVIVVAVGYALGQRLGNPGLSRIVCGILGAVALLLVVIAIVFAGCMVIMGGRY